MRLRLRFGTMLVCSLFLSARGARAAATKIWISDTASDFSAGEARGIAVGIDGSLILSRDARRVEGVSEATLFGLASDGHGTIWAATGNSGKILRISSGGKVDVVATLPEKEVTAITIGPDGSLFAAGSPGGNVYRIADGKPEVYYATKARYVWALVFSAKSLYVGTGLPGEIHRVTAAGKGERIHTTPDAHVRTLFADRRGNVWAGTSGSGLVLRIDASGAVSTVYDSAKSEITAIAASGDGRIWASAGSADTSASGATEPISSPHETPATRASKPAGPGPDEGRDKPEVTVTVSTPRIAPSPTTGAKGGYSSEVLVFDENEPPRVVWTSSQELVFALAPDADAGSVLAATGPNGKLYRIAAGRSSLERTFDEKQVTAIAADAVGTNSATAMYRLAGGPRQGEWVSGVKDTGRTSRFGAFRWEGDESGGRIEFSFRSGESSAPDTTWSAWTAFASRKREDTIPAPPARYLQIKVRMASDGSAVPTIRQLEASYRNRNAAPAVDSLIALGPNEVFARSASGGANVFETASPDDKGIFTSLEESKSDSPPRHLLRKGYRTLTWRATDPDQDPLVYEIEFRPIGSPRWLPLRKGLKENFYSFDTTSLPDGEYVFRLTASDAEANPDDKKSGSRESSPVRIDNTPPVIHRLASAGDRFDFEAVDAASPILEAEYSIDAKEWIRVEPKDGLSDSRTEAYSIPIPDNAKSHGSFLLLRVTDAAHNVSAASFPLP